MYLRGCRINVGFIGYAGTFIIYERVSQPCRRNLRNFAPIFDRSKSPIVDQLSFKHYPSCRPTGIKLPLSWPAMRNEPHCKKGLRLYGSGVELRFDHTQDERRLNGRLKINIFISRFLFFLLCSRDRMISRGGKIGCVCAQTSAETNVLKRQRGREGERERRWRKRAKHKRQNPSLPPLQKRDVQEGSVERGWSAPRVWGRGLVQRRGMGNCNEQPDSYK